MTLPGEEELDTLARRFADAERLVRGLLAQAAGGGDRGELLRQALLVLLGLQRDAPLARQAVEAAYLIAYAAALLLLGRPVTFDPAPIAPTAGQLATRLSGAAQTAQEHAREAFTRVTPDDLEDAEIEAVTARVDRRGRRLALGDYTAMQVETVGRHATSLGTRHALVAAGTPEVTIEGEANDAVCARWVGRTVSAQGPLPPYHPRCQCQAVPAGRTSVEQIDAMRELRKQVYRDFFAARAAA